ncbi:prostaglandin reductase 3-like [Limulus polyphemus]|uniref:Prostaglandin reductase 3-like n=1 Tax=Limulus polyphemus TaxID=6850 RepID=A0ABM1SQW6_LIMPO|nr:prostaglandin reductase 3-like [Limulus polyphemus]XP_013778329.1 prostaglandin reductase 3-like [Limulus polyphemus]XP_022246022.1 prostaglandin reductase 3-like [Limulus polyphemus]XP_022246023.1 prostaglandin reductase 3-like [Limulus polyphemus]
MADTEDLPLTYKMLMVHKLAQKFQEAVKIETVTLTSPGPDEIIVKNRYVGINAIDIFITPIKNIVSKKYPYPVGLESVGEVVALGTDVDCLELGQPVAYIGMGAYSEFMTVKGREVIPIPELKPEYVGLLVSGLTASIGLDKVGDLKAGEKVIITAAAGGLGQICVQWAKNYGCHVIAICSSEEEAAYLMALGCDRVINDKEEKVGDVLKEEYADGVDVVWETVGGEVFLTLLNNLAIKGRMIIIECIASNMMDEVKNSPNINELLEKLNSNSQCVRGFSLFHYSEYIPAYLGQLIPMLKCGKMKVHVDNGQQSIGVLFSGVEGIIKGAEHLHNDVSIGKVVVEML